MSRSFILRAVFVAAFLQAGPAGACYLETIPMNGFSVVHLGTVSMAVATRTAVERDLLEALPADENLRFGALFRVRLLAARHVARLAASATSGPPVSVLLTQSGAWIRLNDPEHGAIYHSDPPASGEAVILLPDRAYETLLRGQYSVSDLERYGLIRIYGDDQEAARRIWVQAIERFGARVGQAQGLAR